jgi:hypothetical protein
MITGLILALLAVSGGKEPRAAAPAYELKLHNSEDRVVAVKEANRTVFVVTCPSGIGEGTIILKAGQWPENVTLRFQHKHGVGLGKLEQLVLKTDRIRADGDSNSSGKFGFEFLDAKGKPGADPRSAGVLNVVVESRDDALDVTLPARMLIGSTRFELRWVNLFRR